MVHNKLDYIALGLMVLTGVVSIGEEPITDVNYAMPIPLIMGIGAAISAIGQGVASIFGNRKKKRALRRLNEQYDNLIADTDDRINANFLDRADSKNAIRKVEESNKEALRQLNTDAVRRGSTDEAKVAMANKLSQRTADVVSELAGIGEQYKDKLRDRKASLQADKAAQNFAIDSDTSGLDAFSSAISQVGNAAINYGATMSGQPTAAQKATANANQIARDTARISTAIQNDFGGVKAAQQKADQDAFNEQVRYGR